ncbi:hypothetical protein MNBD_UNCLBAC01-2068 [hydrothermal vent metagenome]|uniref:BrnT family toxin n=1 Tax=hydrothermal vent metagenome TaxID=652676 RepID=A0A3B1DGH0_9ZZZZ
MYILNQCVGFQWDKGNVDKNFIKHSVSARECEQVFFNVPLIISESDKHSKVESRWQGLGKTDIGRLIFIIFTIRNNLIRVISARDMLVKERRVYLS